MFLLFFQVVWDCEDRCLYFSRLCGTVGTHVFIFSRLCGTAGTHVFVVFQVVWDCGDTCFYIFQVVWDCGDTCFCLFSRLCGTVETHVCIFPGCVGLWGHPLQADLRPREVDGISRRQRVSTRLGVRLQYLSAVILPSQTV